MAGKRGRPVRSQIRQNIIEILHFLGKGYGYDIYKIYVQVFPKVTMRSIYYHLRKGTSLKEFEVEQIKRERGDYSWGTEAEKIYYKLGPAAKPRIDMRIRKLFEEEVKR
ncbi:hypothetical protein GF351_06590 [Candidatus Woesearchaeota archaeon]|nr:hypothetical protein [Candidatus Woesearchaeota archaeon]